MDVPSKWTVNMENGEEFKEKLLAHKELFYRLVEMLDTMEEAELDGSMKKSNYDKVAWSEFQADSIGYRRALRDVKKLCKFIKE